MQIDVEVRLNPSEEEDALDEVYVTASEPYINFVLRLPKAMTQELASGAGSLQLTTETND